MKVLPEADSPLAATSASPSSVPNLLVAVQTYTPAEVVSTDLVERWKDP